MKLFGYTFCGSQGERINYAMQVSTSTAWRLWGAALFLMALSGCVPKQDIPVPSSGSADFSRTVVLGGSELAGYQDGALYREGQEAAIGRLVQQQLQTAGAAAFQQHLLPENGGFGLNKPWVSLYRSASRLGDRTDCEGIVSLGPVSDTIPASSLQAAGSWTVADALDDYAIPHAGLMDWTRRDFGADPDASDADRFAARYAFAGQGKSVLDAALSRQPSFFICWPGMQDMLNWATNGGHGRTLPTAAAFRAQLDSILSQLTLAGAQGVLATVPDIRYLPYFTTIPARALTLSPEKADSLNDIYSLVGASVNFVGGDNGFIVGDPGSSTGFRQMEADEYITLTVPLDSMKCYFMGVLFTLMPDRYTLIRSELTQLRSTIAQYNATILDLAASYDLAVADLATFYSRLETGVRFDGVDFTTEFVSGGYFSLDGLYPHPKGAALAANEVIAAINAHYGSSVPPLQPHVYRGVLFP
jgi:hypothetical protein